jgi:hypothetical protein
LRGKRIREAALALFLLLSATPAAPQEAGERPHIFFEKKVYSDSVGGKRSFYETHTVEKGESLWKILGRSRPLSPERFAERLKDFLRTNPGVKDPSLLAPGQEILVPAEGGEKAVIPAEGKTAGYTVRKGDSLSGIFVSRGAPGSSLKEFLKAVREINPSIEDVDLIYAGSTLRLPTEEYFEEGPAAEPPAIAAPAPPDDAGKEQPLLTRDAPSSPALDVQATAKPQAELLARKGAVPETSFMETGKKEPERDPVLPPASFPYRGLLSDIFSALGEKWAEKGTMFLPLSTGEELVLLLPDFPLVKFQGGGAALIDFRGGLPPRVRDGISDNWKYIRVVSLEDARGAGEMIDRILRVSGYHSVKDGILRPLVIGETVSVVLPARWVIQQTEDSLLSGDLVLLKETPEKPSAQMASILRYARRVGVRVLPYADDPALKEGFLVGIGDEDEKDQGIPVGLVVPSGGGIPAVDFTLSFLGSIRCRERGSGSPERERLSIWSCSRSGSSSSAGKRTWWTRERSPMPSAPSSRTPAMSFSPSEGTRPGAPCSSAWCGRRAGRWRATGSTCSPGEPRPDTRCASPVPASRFRGTRIASSSWQGARPIRPPEDSCGISGWKLWNGNRRI